MVLYQNTKYDVSEWPKILAIASFLRQAQDDTDEAYNLDMHIICDSKIRCLCL